jgi:cytochrome c biogenesis protein CcmG/thiol:disulfide interchange protein DsbE
MNRRWIAVGGAAALLAGGAALALALSPEFFPVEVGSFAPTFRATDPGTGREITLADYRGQVVVLNIWATYCAPCKVEMPSLEALQRDLGPRGLKIVAVSADETGPEVVRQYARDMGLTFQILHDPSGRVGRAYRTTGIPESFVINREGRIVKKVVGPTDWDAALSRDLMRRLLAQGGLAGMRP